MIGPIQSKTIDGKVWVEAGDLRHLMLELYSVSPSETTLLQLAGFFREVETRRA